MSMRKKQRITMPVGQVAAGKGWYLVTGNTSLNVWERVRRVRHRTRCIPLERNPFYDHVHWTRS